MFIIKCKLTHKAVEIKLVSFIDELSFVHFDYFTYLKKISILCNVKYIFDSKINLARTFFLISSGVTTTPTPQYSLNFFTSISSNGNDRKYSKAAFKYNFN